MKRQHNVKKLPKWAQQKITSLESRSGLKDMQTLLAEIYPLLREVGRRPWPTTHDLQTERLYIAAVPIGFETRLRSFMKRIDGSHHGG